MCLALGTAPEWGLHGQSMKSLRVSNSPSSSVDLKRVKVNRIFCLNSCIYFGLFLHLQRPFAVLGASEPVYFQPPGGSQLLYSCVMAETSLLEGSKPFQKRKGNNPKESLPTEAISWAGHQPCSQISYSNSLTRHNWRQNLSTENYTIK